MRLSRQQRSRGGLTLDDFSSRDHAAAATIQISVLENAAVPGQIFCTLAHPVLKGRLSLLTSWCLPRQLSSE